MDERKLHGMANKSVIQTEHAPQAIGPYSQAVKAGDTVYISGQIPLDPETMEVVAGDFSEKPVRYSKTSKPYAKPPVAS